MKAGFSSAFRPIRRAAPPEGQYHAAKETPVKPFAEQRETVESREDRCHVGKEGCVGHSGFADRPVPGEQF